jgi:hypothetical protein
MGAGQDATMESSDESVESAAAGADARARGAARARRQEEREHSLGLIITISLSFILFAAAILLGGHAFIGPLLQRAAAARDANGTGDVVYTMPDGVFCRHVSFDNGTGDVTEDGIEECPGRSVSGDIEPSQFRWGSSH